MTSALLVPTGQSEEDTAAAILLLSRRQFASADQAAIREVANDNLLTQRAIVRTAQVAVTGLWSSMSGSNLARSWAQVRPQVMDTVIRSQTAAAANATGYLGSLADTYGIPDGSTADLVASSLAGVASDGRPLDSLLDQSVRRTRSLLKFGISYSEAMRAGSANLAMHTSTQIFDAGRAAEQVAATARPWAGWSERVCSGRACSRCAVLSGRKYRWNTQFRRHPGCGCRNVYAPGRAVDLPSPQELFDGLTPAEQYRRYSAAGAEAIRQGADIGQVVNARRGMTTATVGGQTIRTTTEGTTKLGSYYAQREAIDLLRGGPRIQRPRLMPEEIIRLANGNRDEARRLLIGNGYLMGNYRDLAAEYRFLSTI